MQFNVNNTASQTARIVSAMPAILRKVKFGHARATGEITVDTVSVQGATPTTPGTPTINRSTIGAAMKIIGAVKHTTLSAPSGTRYLFPNCRTPEQAIALVDAAVIKHLSR